jgi:acyl carrier protein phosphodiesterase
MNLLAHAVLSPPNRLIRVGNVVCDFVHKQDWATLPDAMQRGIELHLAIDHFTDNSPICARSKARLVGYQRFGNPVVDVFYDHFLIKHWPEQTPVGDYIDELYKDLVAELASLPQDAQHIVTRIIEDDWLNCYDDFDGLERTLQRMERRVEWATKRQVDIIGSVQILKENYPEFENDFLEFWPLLTKAALAHRDSTE